ncbi:MAG: CBS domain-containing protein [Deltaproteobacteria bacterium]|nr:CBS domain-containing protein [Deltaproteobacteria bacterium]
MKKIRHLLVMDGSELVGVITDRDVRSHLSPRLDTPVENSEDEKTLETKIHQVMTRDLITVSPDMLISEAAALLLKHKIGCLPVIDEDGFIMGIVTDADFLGYLAREEKAKEDH